MRKRSLARMMISFFPRSLFTMNVVVVDVAEGEESERKKIVATVLSMLLSKELRREK